jgi:hypothetical protein
LFKVRIEELQTALRLDIPEITKSQVFKNRWLIIIYNVNGRPISDHKLSASPSEHKTVTVPGPKFFHPFETGTKTYTSLHPEMIHRDRVMEIPVSASRTSERPGE